MINKTILDNLDELSLDLLVQTKAYFNSMTMENIDLVIQVANNIKNRHDSIERKEVK